MGLYGCMRKLLCIGTTPCAWCVHRRMQYTAPKKVMEDIPTEGDPSEEVGTQLHACTPHAALLVNCIHVLLAASLEKASPC